MNKIFTMFAFDDDISVVEKMVNKLGDEIVDFDKSKMFAIDDHTAVTFTIVCTEETFVKLTKKVNGTRLY